MKNSYNFISNQTMISFPATSTKAAIKKEKNSHDDFSDASVLYVWGVIITRCITQLTFSKYNAGVCARAIKE